MSTEDNGKLDFEGMLCNRKVMLVAVAASALALIGLVLFAHGADGPNNGAIKREVETATMESLPSAGTYDADGTWEISSVDIVSKEKQSMEGYFNNALGDTCYAVTAQVKAGNGSAEVERTVSCGFVKYEGEWQPLSDPRTESETWHALAGPDEKKLAKGASEALRMVDAANRSNELQMLYQDCEATVKDLAFNEEKQTATAQLVFKRENVFSTAKATVDADFKFENGRWTLKAAKADGDAANVSYQKLVGTWRGTFKSTVADEGSCFGAQGKELVLKIASVDDESGKIEGTFQALAHYHAYVDADVNASEGDSDTGEIAFVATLNASEVIGKNYEGMLTMTVGAGFTAPETASGKVRLSFGFGTRDDSNAAVAKVTTQASASKGYRSTSKFEDTYTLTKEK